MSEAQPSMAMLEARAFELQNEPPYDGSLHKCRTCKFFSRHEVFYGWARCMNEESGLNIETSPFAHESEYCPEWRKHERKAIP